MTIKYRLAELKGRGEDNQTSYIGQVIHNCSLDMEKMAERYADMFHIPVSTAMGRLSSFSEFIASEVAAGNRPNFSSFSVSLKMQGRVSRGNETYSAKDNPLRVVMTPNKKLHAAAAKLEPQNVTDRSKPWISSIVHQAMKEEEGILYEVIRLNGGLTTMNAYHCKVDSSREDEGVWLTSADGSALLLKGQIQSNTETTCDVVFPKSDLPAGEYRIEIRSRGKPTKPLVTASKKVTVRTD